MDKSYIANIFYNMIKANEITIDEVPEEYKEEVNAIIAASESQEDKLRQEGYEQALMDLAEATGGAK